MCDFLSADATNRGFQMFARMFQHRPATKALFSFAKGGGSGDSMKASGKLLFHVTRVVE